LERIPQIYYHDEGEYDEEEWNDPAHEEAEGGQGDHGQQPKGVKSPDPSIPFWANERSPSFFECRLVNL
jgi:hypothetical protein